ncbi:hypothetical protein [Bradyrhizobium sp. dw_78]|uniref:hypothetical protein n=1 Tax=Bradyrhizobium sp. dw_78 TaxID=2719793 RepID=UPI001BD45282|nr:hypothetical protein [Bradyrhizobium sp. dw_78]
MMLAAPYLAARQGNGWPALRAIISLISPHFGHLQFFKAAPAGLISAHFKPPPLGQFIALS